MDYNIKKAFLQYMWDRHEDLMTDLVEENLHASNKTYLDGLREAYANLRGAFEAGATFNSKSSDGEDDIPKSQDNDGLDYDKIANNLLLTVKGYTLSSSGREFSYEFVYEPVMGDEGWNYILNIKIGIECVVLEDKLETLSNGLEKMFQYLEDALHTGIKTDLRGCLMRLGNR